MPEPDAKIALTDGQSHQWPTERIIPAGYSELRTALGRIIHTVETTSDHGSALPSEMLTGRGRISLQARDTRTEENPKGRYRTGKDFGRTYWEGPNMSPPMCQGGGRPVKGPFNPAGWCSLPDETRLEAMYPHYSNVAPLDDDVKCARLYYGYGAPNGFQCAFQEDGFGRGVAALDKLHHHTDMAGYGAPAGALEHSLQARMKTLQAADAKIGYLKALEAEQAVRPMSVRDSRFTNRTKALQTGSAVGTASTTQRFHSLDDAQFYQAQLARANATLLANLAVSPRSFI